MADKTYLSKEINFNKAPIMWAGMEVYPGGGSAASNLYGTLNVIKNPQEPNTPDINTDGNVNVKKSVNVKIDVNVDRNVNVKGNVNVDKNVKAKGEVYSSNGAHRLSAKKNFDIPHPTKDGWRLTHSCLEGPEAAVYFRGKLINTNIIKLPEYWENLVDPDTITVSITPIQFYQDIIVKKFNSSEIVLESNHTSNVYCFYHIFGERIDTEKLIVEYEGDIEDYPGDNSERSIAGYHYDKKLT
jgi:hypothetical protein